jgi:hypothetical protein
MKRETEILRIVRETARKLAVNHMALAPDANIMDAIYVANRAQVLENGLALLACEIWAIEDSIILGKDDLPKV